MNICDGCRTPNLTGDFMHCHGCRQKYDLQCADLSPKRFKKLNSEGKLKWRCFECKGRQPKVGNTSTPLRPSVGPSQQPTSDVEPVKVKSSENSNENVTMRRKVDDPTRSASYITEEKLRDIWKNEMRQEMQAMLEATIKRTVSGQLATINSQCTGFQEAITYVSTQYEDLRKEISDLKKLLGTTSSELKFLKEENRNLKDSLSTYGARVVALEVENLKQQQWVRLQNIEITGIPEVKDEMAMDLVLKVVQHIGVTIVPSDLEFAHRVQPRRAESAVRARPIVARLRQRLVKDDIIAAARKYRNLTAKDMGIGGETCKIFVNEHLTKDSKLLLSSSKLRAKEANYRYVWTKNCRIFVRKDEASPPIPINSMSDLQKVV